MPSGDIHLSRAAVVDALESLVYSARSPELNSLAWLLLVDQTINDPTLPPSPHAREYGLKSVLVGLMTRALQEGRHAFGLPLPDEYAPLNEVRQQIAADAATRSPDLLASSLLYHRYVRVDLGLTPDDLSQIIGVDVRTLRRYQAYGVRVLTNRLIDAERTARREGRKRRLYAALPIPVPLPLFGRDAWLNEAEARLSVTQPRHLLVTGAVGMGKSAFVMALVRRQIDKDLLDHVVWIDAPKSVDDVRGQVAEGILREGNVGLREALLVYRVAVVLDEIDTLLPDLPALLADLSAADVYLINSTVINVPALHLPLPELDIVATAALVRAALPLDLREDDTFVSEVAAAAQETVGGNPEAIILLARRLDFAEWETVRAAAQARVFEEALGRLDDGARALACALALCPRGAGALDDMMALWPDYIAAQGAEGLLTNHLAERVHGRYWLAAGLLDYLRTHRAGDVHTMLELLFPDRSRITDGALALVEHLLLSDDPVIDPARRVQWIASLCRVGLARGRHGRWRMLLESASPDTPELRIAYASCLRRLGEWTAAETVLQETAASSGARGQFAEQARALLEWSIAARYRGDYRTASALLTQVERTLKRRPDPALNELLRLELAQMALDEGRGAEALRVLVGLEITPRLLAMQSEAYLLLGDWSACRKAAERGITLLDRRTALLARLYTALGRGYQGAEDVESAYHCMAVSVTVLEQLEDVYALARAQSNLAAVCLQLGYDNEAARLLGSAARIQRDLGDRVGLAATRHNQRLLDEQLAR
jgi:tetratricopeptide (TPR) repeat protein